VVFYIRLTGCGIFLNWVLSTFFTRTVDSYEAWPCILW